nr:MAG TPA: hypothetical protein [Caudoviricetes sp.]DAY85540.1 MAG TPA: hypothetical protein [Caudoviricetes sp.]
MFWIIATSQNRQFLVAALIQKRSRVIIADMMQLVNSQITKERINICNQ